jgi:hypothetical protein
MKHARFRTQGIVPAQAGTDTPQRRGRAMTPALDINEAPVVMGPRRSLSTGGASHLSGGGDDARAVFASPVFVF